MGNIIKVNFDPDKYFIWGIQGLEQWDQGQKLEISGLDISDEIVEVHFSLDEVQGSAKGRLGVVKDGVIHADIPAFILEGPEHIFCNNDTYSAYAWIYVSDDESAETIRKMEFTIKARPKLKEYVTPDELSFLQQLEQAIKSKITTPTSAKVGQLLSVKAVDENGKPTEFDVVDQSKGAEVTVDNALSEESTNPVQNQVVTKEVKTLKERNAKLEETIEKLQIKTTTSPSPFHHITDSANMKILDFGMEGKTEQETVAGNQLFDISKFASHGSITNNGDGTLTTVSYSPNFTNKISVCCPNIVAGMTIIISATNSLATYFGVAFKTNGASFEVTQEMIDADCLGFYGSSTTVSADNPCVISNIMINEGTTAKPIEPFTNGPTPNPDYPQEIVNAGKLNEETGRYEHKVTVGNKNWFDVSQEGTPVGGNRDIPVNIVFGETYILSAAIIGSNGTIALRGFVSESDTAGDQLIVLRTGTNTSGKISGSVTIKKEYHHCAIRLYASALTSFDDIQLELDTETTYTQHASQQITLTSPVPLTKWDNLVKRDGVWGWSIHQLQLAVDGSVGTVVVYNGANGFICNKSVSAYALTTRTAYCNQHICTTTGNVAKAEIWFDSSVYIPQHPLYDDSLDDKGLANFKTHLAENPLEIWTYADTEQAFHPLPDEEQELLNNLETYYGVTNLYNDQGCPMWLEYVNDTKLYTDQQIAKQIAQTQALILEN